MNPNRKDLLTSAINTHLVLSLEDDKSTRVLCHNKLGESLIRQLKNKNLHSLLTFKQSLGPDDIELIFAMPEIAAKELLTSLVASIPDQDLKIIQHANPAMFIEGRKVSMN